MISNQTEKELYRPKEASIRLRVGLSTFWKYVQDGLIKTKKLSPRVTVVTKEELDRFIGASS